MKKTNNKRSTTLPLIRLTPAEKEQIKQDYLASQFTNYSAYIRYQLLASGRSETANREMKIVLLLGSIADEMKVLSDHFVQLVQLRKEVTSEKIPKEEALHLSKILKSIQQINFQFKK